MALLGVGYQVFLVVSGSSIEAMGPIWQTNAGPVAAEAATRLRDALLDIPGRVTLERVHVHEPVDQPPFDLFERDGEVWCLLPKAAVTVDMPDNRRNLNFLRGRIGQSGIVGWLNDTLLALVPAGASGRVVAEALSDVGDLAGG